MRAATLNAPEDLRLVEKDKPTPGKNEVLLKIEANTMCGTDYRLYTGAKTSGVSYGTVPGHEIAGRIVEIGEGVEQIQPGIQIGQQATVSMPFQTFGDKHLYPDPIEKACRYAFGIISGHPFLDGNKRTGAARLGTYLRVSGIDFKPDHASFLDTILGVADGSVGYDELVRWVRNAVE